MRINGKLNLFFLPAFILLCLVGTAVAGPEDEERQKLLEQQKLLTGKVAALRREQDFLLFQKALYAADSKYLVINLSKQTGQLKYKNRVLRDFRFSSGNTGRIAQGKAMLSKKIEAGREPKRLVFGRTLILLPKQSGAAGMPALFLGKKDFKAVFYALEGTAQAYLLR